MDQAVRNEPPLQNDTPPARNAHPVQNVAPAQNPPPTPFEVFNEINSRIRYEDSWTGSRSATYFQDREELIAAVDELLQPMTTAR
jgi:hypothetical protein